MSFWQQSLWIVELREIMRNMSDKDSEETQGSILSDTILPGGQRKQFKCQIYWKGLQGLPLSQVKSSVCPSGY